MPPVKENQQRVAVFFDHGEYKGHFLPTLEVASLMVRRGHLVYYFASESVKDAVQRYQYTHAIMEAKMPCGARIVTSNLVERAVLVPFSNAMIHARKTMNNGT